MTIKTRISKLIEESNKFENYKSWNYDGSKAKLFKRKK